MSQVPLRWHCRPALLTTATRLPEPATDHPHPTPPQPKRSRTQNDCGQQVERDHGARQVEAEKVDGRPGVAAAAGGRVARRRLHHAVTQQCCPVVAGGHAEQQQQGVGEAGEVNVRVQVALPRHLPKQQHACGGRGRLAGEGWWMPKQALEEKQASKPKQALNSTGQQQAAPCAFAPATSPM